MANAAVSKNNTPSELETYFYNSYKKIHWHKSFDFSNVGRWESDFRRFHQMCLYIQTPRLFSHANATGGKKLGTNETAVISCNLPEQISYTIGSEWEAPLSSFGTAMTNLLLQTAGNAITGGGLPSGINRATTFKIWSKTKPLTLDLRIPVIDDTADGDSQGEEGWNTNLVEALEYLGTLVLPQYEQGNIAGFYTPPPSPLAAGLTFHGTSQTRRIDIGTKQRARIILQLGGMLLVDNCIIESVSVKYPNTKAMIMHDYSLVGENFGSTGEKYLHPLLAEVNIKVSTIEALTANTYSKMLWARGQTDQGKFYGSVGDKTPIIQKFVDGAFGIGDLIAGKGSGETNG